jgi:hypothetical protein
LKQNIGNRFDPLGRGKANGTNCTCRKQADHIDGNDALNTKKKKRRIRKDERRGEEMR